MAKNLPTSKKPTTIWLEPEGGDTKMFFCFNCRIPIIEYNGSVMQIVPGHSPYTPGTVLKCKGSVQRNGEWHECGMLYSFVGAIHTRNPEMT